jgi:hydroxymethylglutaryl-CoA lyase/(R)-citramalyl-CoA lyase
VVRLTEKQAQLFLGKNFGAVATIRSDGTPHVTPVWIDYDGEHVVFNTATGRAKWHHMRRDPRVTIEVYAQDDPYDYVTVTGTVELEEGEAADRHIDKLSEKYTGNPRFQSPPARRAQGDRPGHARAGSLITICEVGPRDGLQNEKDVLPPETRAELVNRLAAAGLPVVEAVSFVSAERVPQMAGAEEVVGAIERRDGTVYAGLALNEKGYDRLREAGLDEVRFALAATESFSQRNANATVAEATEAAEKVLARAREDGLRSTITISVSFGCPFEGAVDPGKVVELAKRLSAADDVVLADTIGVATPGRVRKLIEDSGASGFHGHNTRNTGFANAFAAVEAGATTLDSSIGGLGGCPFAPKATGNIATEDLVYMLEGDGVETGVDLDALIEISQWLEQLLGRQLEGQVYRAGASRVSPST